MSSDSAAVFAQVIPALIIATFLSNIGFKKMPPVLRTLLFYFFGLAVIGEAAALYSVAFDVTLGSELRGTVFISSIALLLLMVAIIGARMLVRYDQPGSDAQDTKRDE